MKTPKIRIGKNEKLVDGGLPPNPIEVGLTRTEVIPVDMLYDKDFTIAKLQGYIRKHTFGGLIERRGKQSRWTNPVDAESVYVLVENPHRAERIMKRVKRFLFKEYYE